MLGGPYDIHVLFGVSYTEVFRSVDIIVDAVNSTSSLDITFPTDHEEQKKLAGEFESISAAGFKGCCGCIDGLLIWIHRPSQNECAAIGIGSTPFYCGRKHKFSLNLQALCDRHLRFTDISILFGGATSDTLVFELSSMKHKLDTPGFLSPGLFVVGDNAYLNTPFLAIPSPNV